MSHNPVQWVEELSQFIGFDMDLVTPPPQQRTNNIFHCGVCLGFPRNPRYIGCRHIMCNRCFLQLQQPKCPTCRNRITGHFLIGNMYGSDAYEDYVGHRIRCRLSNKECGFADDPITLNDHQQGCSNTPWINATCGHYIANGDRALHEQYHQWERGIVHISQFLLVYLNYNNLSNYSCLFRSRVSTADAEKTQCEQPFAGGNAE